MRTLLEFRRRSNPLREGSDVQRLGIMRLFLLLAFVSFTVFGSLQVVEAANPMFGLLGLAAAGAIALIALALQIGNNVALARVCFLLTLLSIFIAILATGGTAGVGFLWLCLFPMAAFFLAGTREGLFWVALFFGVIIALWLLAHGVGLPFYYSDIAVRQLTGMLVVVSVGCWAYQRSRERWEAAARKSHADLKAYLRQMTALHTKLDHAKSEFVTLTSHQLRTPISAIRWLSEMLLNGDAGRLHAIQADAVKGIEDSNHRLGAIVDAMLAVSSLELGELSVKPEPTNLATSVSKALKDAAKRYADKQLVFKESYDPDLPALKLDAYVIKRTLAHLFSNACKYTPAGGTVSVRVARRATRLTPKSAGSVAIIVSDTGYGIPASEQHDVFAKLFRADNIKTKDTDGTGLSLYIVKAMIDLVGGQVSFVSEENKGSTFTVVLPLEGMKKHDIGRMAKGVGRV